MIILDKKIIFILLSAVLLFSLGCQRDKPTDTGPQGIKEDFPDQEGWNSTIRSTNKGQVDALIKYGHMARYSKKKMVHFDEGVKVDFFDTEGTHTSTLTAKSGNLNEQNNDVEAQGNVVVVSDSGVTLFTEHLFWNQKTEKIVSEVDVMITTDNGDTLYGTGFESDPELANWKITELHGIAHSSMDLSTERWEKSHKDSSITSTEIDSNMIDNISTSTQDTVSVTPQLPNEDSLKQEP